MGAGQSEISNIGLNKGEGLRILRVAQNSPLDGKVHEFFDFIVDVIPSVQSDKTPKQILGKLTDDKSLQTNKKAKSFEDFIADNVDSLVTLKIVSTKYRQVYNVQITPNRNWNGSQDLLGLQLRKQRYDEAFDTYFPFSDIKIGSPIQKAGILTKQFLIGCYEFKYISVNDFLENIYDRFYDKQIIDKTIVLAIYNIYNDNLRLVPVILARGWGDKGLLGCQFLQGQINRYPKNIREKRQQIMNRQKEMQNQQKIKNQLNESSGASHNLVENLKVQRNKRKKHLKNLKNILWIEPKKQINEKQQIIQSPAQIKQNENIQISNVNIPNPEIKKISQLQERVHNLENTIQSLKSYIERISDDQLEEQY